MLTWPEPIKSNGKIWYSYYCYWAAITCEHICKHSERNHSQTDRDKVQLLVSGIETLRGQHGTKENKSNSFYYYQGSDIYRTSSEMRRRNSDCAVLENMFHPSSLSSVLQCSKERQRVTKWIRLLPETLSAVQN